MRSTDQQPARSRHGEAIRHAPSGEQFEIRHGDQRATIVEVGGGVREYEAGGRLVLDPYPIEEMCDGAHGAVLVPWPNRLADGRYRFDGVDHQVALTEPDKANAIHGFLRWRSWRASERTPSRVVVRTRLHPMVGYPFCLDVSVAYELGDGGLVVATTATNIGGTPCPYGCGQHPYLSPGTGLIDACTLQLAARTRILTDNERQLPTGRERVAGTPFDFSAGKRLGDQKLDFAFTDLTRDESGYAWVGLSAPDEHVVQLWVDEHYPILELYTGDTLGPERRRRGLGTEPMTCPPNAFQSGDGLLRLKAGQSLTTTWGVRVRRRPAP
jgi:aldose 1-epimerase